LIEYNGKKSYDYLLSMPIWSFTDEKLAELEKKQVETAKILLELKAKTKEDLWRIDLEEFKLEYDKLVESRQKTIEEELNLEAARVAGAAKQKKKKRSRKK